MSTKNLAAYLKTLECPVSDEGKPTITKPGMYLFLLHGRRDPKQDMDEWGFDGPAFGPLRYFHVTYASVINLCSTILEDEGTGPMLDEDPMHIKNDMLYYGGAYYGDWTVVYVP